MAGSALAHTGSKSKPSSWQTGILPGSNNKPFDQGVFQPDILAETIRFSELCLPGPTTGAAEIQSPNISTTFSRFEEPTALILPSSSFGTFWVDRPLECLSEFPLASTIPNLDSLDRHFGSSLGLVSNKGDKARGLEVLGARKTSGSTSQPDF